MKRLGSLFAALVVVAGCAKPPPPVAGKAADYVKLDADRLYKGWEMTDAPDGAIVLTNPAAGGVITIAAYPDETDKNRMIRAVTANLSQYGYEVEVSPYYEPYFDRPHMLFRKGDRLEGQVVIMPIPGMAKGLLVVQARCRDGNGSLSIMIISDLYIRDLKAKF